ncbi:MAG TPA: glycosyltransferase family 2 protein [Cyclobacteriaceae bacterium]|nr:glycosyltransferase family 2 protein [Cyclobacteriaceae bacterium]
MKPSIKHSSVAIILLNWNGFDFTKACLESLRKISYPHYQVILVDNGSTDDSLNKLKGLFPEVVFLTSSINLGFTGGNNLGISHALEKGFQFVLLLNNDTLVEEDFLEPMVRHLLATPSCAAVQPLIYFVHDRKKLWNAGGNYSKWWGNSATSYKIKDAEQPYATDWITGCAILLKSSSIERIGLLDNAYFAYHEDVDWSLRLRKAEMTLAVVPKSKIYHVAGASSTSKTAGKEGFLDPKVHFLNVRNQLFQLRKYALFPYALTAWPYNAAKILGLMGYFVLKRRWGKLNATLDGVKEGILRDLA